MGDSELRTEDSLQTVKYLGKIFSPYARGIGIATVSIPFIFIHEKSSYFRSLKEPVRILWKRSKKGSRYNRCALSIHPRGLSIYEEIANGTYKSVWYDAIENISYCVAEPVYRRIFAWIARSTYSNELECHVVLCDTRRQARLLADLLAKTFYQTYQHRQEQIQQTLTPKSSKRCSVCDTISRQHQPSNRRVSLLINDDSMQDKQGIDDYEHISYHGPVIARAFVRGYEENSMHSSTHRSMDYDTTLADEDSIKPMEYYRR